MNGSWELSRFGTFLLKSATLLTLAGLFGGFSYTAYEDGGTIGFVVFQAAVMTIIAVLAILQVPRWFWDAPISILVGAFAFAPYMTREMLGWTPARAATVWVIASAVYMAVVLVGRRIVSPREP